MVRSYSQNYQTMSCNDLSKAIKPPLVAVTPVNGKFYFALIKATGFCAVTLLKH